MAEATTQTTTEYNYGQPEHIDHAPESVIDIRQIEVRDGVAHPRALGDAEYLTAGGRNIALYFGPQLYRPNPAGMGGDKIVFGVSVATGDGRKRQLLQRVSAPLRFDRGKVDYNWQPEQDMLEGLPQLAAELPSGALDHLVAPLPHAEMTEHTMYSSTAQGVSLETALRAVVAARNQAGVYGISYDEENLIAQALYDAPLQTLRQLHSANRLHQHAGPHNFTVGMDGRVTLFDYSDVIKISDWQRPDYWQGEATDWDNTKFTGPWSGLMYKYKLRPPSLGGMSEERKAAAAEAFKKLQPAVIRMALSDMGITGVSDQEVDCIIAAERAVIDNAPTVAYPQEDVPVHAGVPEEGSASRYDTEADADELLFEEGHRLLQELVDKAYEFEGKPDEQEMPPAYRERIARHILRELMVRAVRHGKRDKSGLEASVLDKYEYDDGFLAAVGCTIPGDQAPPAQAQVSKYIRGKEYFAEVERSSTGSSQEWKIEYRVTADRGGAIWEKAQNTYRAAFMALALARGYVDW